MKEKSKLTKILVAALVLVTVIAAAVHLTTRTQVPELSVLIEENGVSETVDITKLELTRITGQVKNQKGDVLDIDAPGIELKDLLTKAGFTPGGAKVVADDEYSAAVTEEELLTEGKVCLLRQEDDTLRLIVFGDENSKRNVNKVARIQLGGADEG